MFIDCFKLVVEMRVNDSVANLGAVAKHALPDYFPLISFKLPAGFPSLRQTISKTV